MFQVCESRLLLLHWRIHVVVKKEVASINICEKKLSLLFFHNLDLNSQLNSTLEKNRTLALECQQFKEQVR